MIIYAPSNSIRRESYGDNMFHIHGMNTNDYVKRVLNPKGITGPNAFNEFWNIKSNTMNLNFNALFNSDKFTKKDFEGLVYGNGLADLSSEDIAQVSGAIDSWNRWIDIKNGADGRVITFDTETYGDILNKGFKTNNVFGINEIGVSVTTYKNGSIYLGDNALDVAGKIAGTSLDNASIVGGNVMNGYSETILTGITKEESGYLESVLTKWGSKGLANLTPDEQVIANRLTVYGSADISADAGHISKVFDGLFSMKNASAPGYDYDTAVMGLKKLNIISDAYAQKGLSQADIVFRTLQGAGLLDANGGIAQNILNGTDIAVAANSKFDIRAIRNIFNNSSNDIYKNTANSLWELEKRTADITYAVRAFAATNNMTIPEYLKSLGFKEGTASMESLLKSMGFSMEQMHIAGSDASNERFVGDAFIRKLETNRLQMQNLKLDENGVPVALKRTNEDSVLFFKNGVFNKREGTEYAVINGTPTDSASFNGQFWQIDKDKTGIVEMQVPNGKGDGGYDTVRKHVITFTDYADTVSGAESPAKLVLTGDTEDELYDRIKKMSVIYDKNNLIDNMVISQKKYHQADIARRAFDRFLDTNDVAVNGAGVTSGGYARLQKSLNLMEALGIDSGDINSTDMPGKILKTANEKNIKLSYYEAQELAGVAGKLNNEKALLTTLIDTIGEQIPDNNELGAGIVNLQRTKALNTAYNNILSTFGEKDTQSLMNIYDRYGVDVKVGEDIVYRINAQNASSAASGFDNIIKNHMMNGSYIDRSILGNTLDNLVARDLVSQSTVDSIMSNFGSINPENQYQYVSSAIARDLTQVNPWTGASSNRKFSGLLQSFGDQLESSRIIMYDGESFSDVFSKAVSGAIAGVDQSSINSIIRDAVKATPNIQMLANYSGYNGDYSKANEQIANIAKSLNIRADNDIRVIQDMFNGNNIVNGKVQYKDYAINAYANDDITYAILSGGEKQSSYVAVGKKNDIQKLLANVAEDNYDMSTYGRLTANKDIFKNAAIIELPYIDEFVTSNNPTEYSGAIRMATLGDSHKIMLTPELRLNSKTVNGKETVSMYMNSGIYETLTSYRQGGKRFMELVKGGNYEEASKLIRRNYLRELMERPGSASAKSLVGDIEEKITRGIQFTTTDILQADRIKIGNALDDLFTSTIKTQDDDLFDVINRYIISRGLNDSMPMHNNESRIAYFNRIINNNRSGFKEYFKKHMFQSFNQDDVIQGLSNRVGNMSFFTLMENAINKTVNGTNTASLIAFDSTVSKALNSFKSLFPNNDVSLADQLISVGAYQHGYIGTGGINSAFYNINASASNNIRPTYGQMNNPIPFMADTFNESVAALNEVGAFSDGTPSFIRASAGNTMVNKNLYDAQQNLMKSSSTIRDALTGRENEFLAAYRNMNDLELNGRIKALENISRADRTKIFGSDLSDEEFDKAVQYFKSTYGSFEEGSAVMHPDLANSSLMKQREATNFTLPLEKLNIKDTKRRLSDIVESGGKIQRGDIIGYMQNGGAYFYQGGDVRLTKTGLEELIPEGLNDVDDIADFGKAGKTKVEQLGTGHFGIEKIHINLNEKAMVRGVNLEGFMSYMGYDINSEYNKKIAMDTMRGGYEFMFGKATIVGNFNVAKHGNNFAMMNKYNLLTSEFGKSENGLSNLYNFIKGNYSFDDITEDVVSESGKVTKKFVGIKITDPVIGGIDIYDPAMYGNRWTMTDHAARNSSAFIDDLYSRVLNYSGSDGILSKETVANLNNINDYFINNNITLARVHRQNINEFMGNFMTVNARVEQSLYLMGQGNDDLMTTLDILNRNNEYVSMLRKYSGGYDATSASLAESGTFGKFINRLSQGLNSNRIMSSTALENSKATRAISGMISVMQDYNAGGIEGNFGTISIADFLKTKGSHANVASGLSSAAELENAPVFIDGKPSKYIEKIIEGKDQNMIMLDLDGAKITQKIKVADATGKMVEKEVQRSSVLIPIHDIDTMLASGEYTTMQDQSATMGFISRVANIKRNPGSGNINEKISAAYMDYIMGTENTPGVIQTLSKNKKESLLFRNASSYVMPTSMQLEAESEASALVKALTDTSNAAENPERARMFQKAVEREKELVKKIATNDFPKRLDDEWRSVVSDYADSVATKGRILNEVADEIKNGKYSDLDVNANKYIQKALRHVDASGKLHYGMVASISQEAFENMGLNMNTISYDIIRDIEKNSGNLDRLGSIVADVGTMYGDDVNATIAEINLKKGQIIGRMNDILEGTGYHIDSGRSLIDQLNEITENVLKLDSRSNGADLTKAINASLAGEGNNNLISRLFGAFSDSMGKSLGTDYLQNVGIYAHLIRQPVFSSQPFSRIMLDPTMNGMGNIIRMWSPIYTGKTHVDFDGDTMFISAILDGSSVLGKDDERYRMLANLYNDYVEKFSNDNIAEYVRDGAFAKHNLLYSEKQQRASIMQLINESQYNEAVKKFETAEDGFFINAKAELQKKVANGDITEKEMESVLDTFRANSNEVSDLYNTMAINVSNDPKMIISSIAAKERNLYIGSVSTPNFKMRDAARFIINNSATGSERQNNAVELLNYLTNTGNIKGGLLSITEQSSIDTKKAIDALTISEIGMYASGLTTLKNAGLYSDFNTNTDKFRNRVAVGVEGVIRGSGPNVYGFLRDDNSEEIISSLKRLSERDYSEIKQIARNLAEGKNVPNEFEILRGNAGAAMDVAQFKNIASLFADKDFNNIAGYIDLFDEGSWMADIGRNLELWENLMHKNDGVNVAGTTISSFANMNLSTGYEKSAQRIKPFSISDMAEDKVYFVPGISGENESMYAVTREGENVKAFNIDDWQSGSIEGSVKLSRRQLDAINESDAVNLGMFQNNPQYRMEALGRASERERALYLNDMVEDVLNGKSDVIKNISSDSITEYSGRIGNLSAMMSSSNAESIRQLADAYDNIARTHAGLQYDSASSLIRQLNEDIARNPRNTSFFDADENLMPFEKLLRERIKSVISPIGADTDAILDSSISKSVAAGGNLGEIFKNIENLRRNVYNIDAQKQAINEGYELLNSAKNILDNMKVSDDRITELTNAIGDREAATKKVIDAIAKNNEDIVTDAESKIYGMLSSNNNGSIKESLNAIFGLDTADASSRVAFGERMGMRFSELNNADAEAILNASVKGVSKEKAAAIEATQEALNAYKKSLGKDLGSSSSFVAKSQQVNELLDNLHDVYERSLNNIDDEAKYNAILNLQKAQRNAAKEASEGMKIRSLAGNIFNVKTVGIAAGALAAIGLANKIIHGSNNDSPLVPSGSNGEQGSSPSYEAPYGPSQSAFTGENNMYVDQESGIKFKVSAKTKSKMMAMNAAPVAANYGKGGGMMKVHADNSKINGNWLANRFAELSE